MNSTSFTHPVTRAQRSVARAGQADRFSSASPEATEERRWLVMLGIPFVMSACFFAATIGTGILWLLAPAMVLGPGLIILGCVYLGISSDTNSSG